MYDAATGTGAQIDGNVVRLHFIDGQRGDDIPMHDGMIIDKGGPGLSVINADGVNVSGGSGGGGCFVSCAVISWILE
jgi:hypothetical protein